MRRYPNVIRIKPIGRLVIIKCFGSRNQQKNDNKITTYYIVWFKANAVR